MKIFRLFSIVVLVILLAAFRKNEERSNGELIYMTGKNKQGESLLNKNASRIKIARSCKTCHGKNGDAMKHISISYSFLSDSTNFGVPYNDSLLYRFLDHDLRSDGSKANIGVIWKMDDADKKDLVAYLKTL